MLKKIKSIFCLELILILILDIVASAVIICYEFPIIVLLFGILTIQLIVINAIARMFDIAKK